MMKLSHHLIHLLLVMVVTHPHSLVFVIDCSFARKYAPAVNSSWKYPSCKDSKREILVKRENLGAASTLLLKVLAVAKPQKGYQFSAEQSYKRTIQHMIADLVLVVFGFHRARIRLSCFLNSGHRVGLENKIESLV